MKTILCFPAINIPFAFVLLSTQIKPALPTPFQRLFNAFSTTDQTNNDKGEEKGGTLGGNAGLGGEAPCKKTLQEKKEMKKRRNIK